MVAQVKQYDPFEELQVAKRYERQKKWKMRIKKKVMDIFT